MCAGKRPLTASSGRGSLLRPEPTTCDSPRVTSTKSPSFKLQLLAIKREDRPATTQVVKHRVGHLRNCNAPWGGHLVVIEERPAEMDAGEHLVEDVHQPNATVVDDQTQGSDDSGLSSRRALR